MKRVCKTCRLEFNAFRVKECPVCSRGLRVVSEADLRVLRDGQGRWLTQDAVKIYRGLLGV